uniref:Putative secreted protein n=1 Tax=Ixodes ricinus TaxID=34613 RepID=A0A147BCJ3_IXORI
MQKSILVSLVMVPGVRLCPVRSTYYPAHTSKVDPEVATNDVADTGVSCCRTSRSWRLVVEMLAKSTSESECRCCPRRPNFLLLRLPWTVTVKSDLQQNWRLLHPPQLLGHHQGSDQRQHDTCMTSSSGN